ncbi:MAG TPA: ATP-dependent Clp protease proteolytic subunit [Chthoniobacteraceae bacterium]|nr:ATP-dependent Clp protease proteolytic subunit [Chthoniobacteraceae bacterium]
MSKLLVLGCFLLSLVSTVVCGADAGTARNGDVVVVKLKGEVDDTQFYCVRRALKNAETMKASAVIIDIDTYGGSMKSAMDIMNALMKSDVPTYTFVDDRAMSAGALISIASGKIYMSPTGVIGAAAPVDQFGGNLESTMQEKVLSMETAVCHTAAQKNGYRDDVVRAFFKDDEVKIGDTVINPKGSLLSLNANEAVKVYDNKPLLAAGIVSSIDDLRAKEHLTGPVINVKPTGFEVMAYWLTNYSFLLLLGGIIGAYLEAKFHGTMISGIVSLCCFILFFTGQYVAGLAGWEVFVAFVIGVLLVIGEIFLHPGTIFPGLAGVVLIVGSLLWAMIDRYPDQPLVPTAQMLLRPMLTLGGAIAAAALVIYFLGKYLPETPILSRLALATANPQGPSLSLNSPDSPLLVKVGETGVAKSNLRPSGKAEFGNALVLDVITQGEFVAPYSKIRIVAIEGPRIVVESC